MVVCYPSTPGKLAMTTGCFLGGIFLFAVGIHYSYKNVAPQQARVKARSEFVREYLRKKHGYVCPKIAQNRPYFAVLGLQPVRSSRNYVTLQTNYPMGVALDPKV